MVQDLFLCFSETLVSVTDSYINQSTCQVKSDKYSWWSPVKSQDWCFYRSGPLNFHRTLRCKQKCIFYHRTSFILPSNAHNQQVTCVWNNSGDLSCCHAELLPIFLLVLWKVSAPPVAPQVLCNILGGQNSSWPNEFCRRPLQTSGTLQSRRPKPESRETLWHDNK